VGVEEQLPVVLAENSVEDAPFSVAENETTGEVEHAPSFRIVVTLALDEPGTAALGKLILLSATCIVTSALAEFEYVATYALPFESSVNIFAP
jgi:hypothetical protein